MSTEPDYSHSMSEPVRRALQERQDRVDQAAAVAALLLDRFQAMAQGHDGPDDSHVESALKVIVERLRHVDALADAVALETRGRELIGPEVIHG